MVLIAAIGTVVALSTSVGSAAVPQKALGLTGAADSPVVLVQNDARKQRNKDARQRANQNKNKNKNNNANKQRNRNQANQQRNPNRNRANQNGNPNRNADRRPNRNNDPNARARRNNDPNARARRNNDPNARARRNNDADVRARRNAERRDAREQQKLRDDRRRQQTDRTKRLENRNRDVRRNNDARWRVDNRRVERRDPRWNERRITTIDRRRTVVVPGDRRNVRVYERRVVNGRGDVRVYRSRRVTVVDRRYYNRYYGGRSVWYSPPPGAVIAASAFAVSAAIVTAAVVHETLAAPPVVAVPRRYTFDEIVENPEVRQYVRSVDVDTITFRSGEARIPDSELRKLDNIAEGIQKVLENNPNQTFLIEGHTDAVGAEEDNLDLSEERAFAVKIALIEEYGINGDALEVAGYGEQYLKVETNGPSRENRRVTVRNISSLLAER